jgi:hypothetical protein
LLVQRNYKLSTVGSDRTVNTGPNDLCRNFQNASALTLSQRVLAQTDRPIHLYRAIRSHAGSNPISADRARSCDTPFEKVRGLPHAADDRICRRSYSHFNATAAF